MHRAFAAWLIAKPWRAFLLAAAFGVLSPQGMSPVAVVAGGIPVLLMLARNSQLGLQAAIAGSVAVAALLLTSGQTVLLSAVSIGLVYIAPLALAHTLLRSGSLSWCFQVAVLGASALVTAIYVGLDDPVGRWQLLLKAAAKQVADSGLVVDESVLLKSLASANWGTYVGLGLLTVLGSLFIGCWWHSLQQATGAFGKEFQQLRLGKVLGSFALLSVIAATTLNQLAMPVPYLDALAWVAGTGLMLQGLAAVHRIQRLEKTPRKVVLTMMYVLLIVELKLMTVVLSVWGVVDSWRKPPAVV